MINQLTFTRFIAAILIVILHFGGIFKGKISFIDDIWEHFNLGVSYFYVLSGFVMIVAYKNLEKINSKKYYINRLARIYPLHILSMLLVIFFILLEIINNNIPKLAVLNHILLIQAWIPRTALTLNAPAWSISVETFFYLLFPFIFSYFKRISLIKTIIISIGFCLISQIIYNYYYFNIYEGFRKDGYFLFYNPLLHLNSFIIGIATGFLFIKNSSQKKYDLLIILLTCLLITVVYLSRNLFIHNGFFAPLFALLIYFISKNNGWITKLFTNKKLIYLGEISFAIYLLQFPVFYFSKYSLKLLTIENELTLFLISLITLILVSHLTYKHFEIPVRDYLKRKIK
ncbi:acyltransferase [Empedobacter tilapiae]|uniref:Acyltransferase n=1 Tax=Empedobacter tilapiae TaxID=2491114 RepID=A0A4Z1CCV5_9FLAO|nr:acyltransferase [Empedobacter tilapiae]